MSVGLGPYLSHSSLLILSRLQGLEDWPSLQPIFGLCEGYEGWRQCRRLTEVNQTLYTQEDMTLAIFRLKEMMSLYQQRGVRVKGGIEIPNSQVWSLYHLLSSLSKPASRGGLPDGNNPVRWHQGKRELASLSWEKEKSSPDIQHRSVSFWGVSAGPSLPCHIGTFELILSAISLCIFVHVYVHAHTQTDGGC